MKPTTDSVVSPTPATGEGVQSSSHGQLHPRRSFIQRAGAALSGTLAAAVAATAGAAQSKVDETGALKGQLERLSNELGMLEDTNAIRKLHHSFGDALNRGSYEEVVSLFCDECEVHFNGGTFVGKNDGVRRLYVERFGQRFAGKHFEPVHARVLGHTHEQDVIELAPDRRSAMVRFHCLVQVEAAAASNLPIVEMARLQGQGVTQWWESGVYESSCVKSGTDWKIERLVYRRMLTPQRGNEPGRTP